MHLADSSQDFGSVVSPVFLSIVGMVRFAETFRKFLFVLPATFASRRRRTSSRTYVMVCVWLWRHLTRLGLYFHGSHEKSVVGPGKLGAPKVSAVLEKTSLTAYEYMIDLFPRTTAIGKPRPAVRIRPFEPRSRYSQSPIFRNVKEHFFHLMIHTLMTNA